MTHQDSCQGSQSDLEVILEFLGEYYSQKAEDTVYWTEEALAHDRSLMSFDEVSCGQQWMTPDIKPDPEALLAHAAASLQSQSYPPNQPNFASTTVVAKQQATAVGRGGKVRLFHFLFEMLEDPTMAHCVSWVPSSVGVFRFSSRNKDQLAALWGQRKGNKRPMTYQKMSRALRNYARSGEIFKVKKKLTYKFSESTLMLLHKCHQGQF